MRLVQSCLAACLVLTPYGAEAWDMMGTKRIELRTRDGDIIPVGSVTFKPDGQGSRFKLALDLIDFRDHFLSMRDFKCVEGPELQCYVPYPYKNPTTVTRADLSWLEHSLIFFFKAPTDYGSSWQTAYITRCGSPMPASWAPRNRSISTRSPPRPATSTYHPWDPRADPTSSRGRGGSRGCSSADAVAHSRRLAAAGGVCSIEMPSLGKVARSSRFAHVMSPPVR